MKSFYNFYKMIEGYKILPPIDQDRYPKKEGLEGPMMTRSSKVLYYDPKEGKYYDSDRDMYLSYEEFQNYDQDYSGFHQSPLTDPTSKEYQHMQRQRP